LDCDNTTALSSGEVCVGGKVRRLWHDFASKSTNPEVLRLNKCLADLTQTRDFVQFGQRVLCYAGDKEDVCKDAPANQRCPLAADAGGCPGTLPQFVSLADSFQWFEINERLPQTPPIGLCSEVRRLRSGLGS